MLLSPRFSGSRVTALLASAVLAAATPLYAQVRSTPMRPVAPPAAANPATPAPDPDNTGKPDDPAGPQSREPGDLMSSGTLVYVDDSFDSVQALRTAIHYASQGQSQLAITSFQDITAKFGQKLVLLNDNSYVSITDYVRERLLAMPAVKNGLYDQLYGLDARRAVDDAIANRDVATLIRVCDRYFPSAAAVRGLAQAADWYFERGEFSAAALTWSKLLTHPQAADRKAEFLFRAALAEHLAQDSRSATRWRDQLARDYADASATIAGKPVKLLAKLDELLAQPAWEAAGLASDEWPAFQGGPSRSLLLNSNAAIGAKLWSLPMADVGDAAGQQPAAQNLNGVRFGNQQAQASYTGEDVMMGGLGSFPVLSNGDVFVHLGTQIMALSASSGAKLWSYPNMQRDTGPQAANHRVAVNPYLSGHESACVFGDQVFAVLLPSLVVCLKRDDGSLIWSRNASEIKTEKEGNLTFIGSPLVTRQGVFVMARKSSEQNFTPQYLVRLDRETGAPTWSCYLCSTMNIYNQGLGGNIPVPTLVDDVLYLNTGQGADCAVDANVGRILWLRVTASRNSAANGGDPVQAQLLMQRGLLISDSLVMMPQLTSWKCNPPLVLGDKMLSTDSQFLRIYDRWNGKILKAVPVADLIDPANVSGTPTLDVLAGAVGGKIVMSIRNAEVCFDLASLLTDKPQPEWVSNVTGAGTAEGRPFLTTSGYYVPFTGKLVRVDLKTGKADAWDWPHNERDEPGKPGNLLVTSEQVVVVNDQEVSGYSKWEVARDNRLARIKEAPQNPLPYLDLAEVAFRTVHQDMAQENMKQAVDLANAGSVPGGSVPDMLGRLYRTNLAFAELLLAKDDKVLRDQSRFYFEQCRATARTPEQGAEWRMQLSELSLKQKKYDEASILYSEILADPALRAAGYHEPDGMLSAAASAERHMKDLIALAGPDVYQRFETQAAALTQRATAAHDAAALQQVVDVYPNSAAALSAASTLADICLEKQDWDAARRALWWLEPRIEGPAQALAIAHLAQASIGLKKYPSAAAWVARGSRQFKDFSWNQAGQKLTFEDLKAQVLKVGGAELDGRLPTLPKGLNAAKMEAAPMGLEIANQYGPQLLTQLLVPVETSPALRQPNLIFIRSGSDLHIRDPQSNRDIGKPASLPASADTVLVGATKDFAVLLQAGTAIGVDLKTHETWKQQLKVPPANPARPSVPANVRQVTIANGMQVQVVNGNWVLNGNGTLGPVDSLRIVDQDGNPILPDGGTDPESVRRAAFLPLGNTARFTTARLLNGNLVVLAGNQIDAFNIETGHPAWTASGGQVITAHLPNGNATCLVGNEDMIVAQVDDPDGHSSTFCAFDAETGKPGKTLKLDNERALWRALGDDGTLYVVTDKAVAAYDLVSAKNVWRNLMQRDAARGDAAPRFAAATALTLDGLIFVGDDNTIHCLSLESGMDRWPGPPQAPAASLKLELANAAGSSSLRSTIIGDVVVFQSADGSAAFKTQPQPAAVGRDYSAQLAWNATYPPVHPPGLGMQAASGCLVEFLSGQVQNLGQSRADMFVIWEAVGGKLDFSPWVNQSGDTTNPGAGPQIRSWQVVDGGIVFETIPNGSPLSAPNMPGTVYFWRIKPNP